MSLSDENMFTITLPSNVNVTGGGVDNKPWDFEVPLVRPLHFKSAEE